MLNPTEAITPKLRKTRASDTVKMIGSRIKQVRKAFKLTQAKFAVPLRISHSNLSEAESGKNTPSGVLLVAICLHYNVNMEFLEHGRGKMFKDVGPSGGHVSSEEVIPHHLWQHIATTDTHHGQVPGSTPGQFVVKAGEVVGLALPGDLLLLAPLDKNELAGGMAVFVADNSGGQLVTKVLEMGKDFFLYPSPLSADPVKFDQASYSSIYRVVSSYRCIL